jgi:hypothetical protein
MTRISSLLVTSALAILPISAFAQTTVAPAKTAESSAVTTTAPMTGKTATATTPAAKEAATKPDAKTPAPGAKTAMHGLDKDTTGHSKTPAPVKTADPAKS